VGVITDVFVASDQAAQEADFATNVLSELFPTFQAKGVFQLELAALDAALAGEDMTAWSADVERVVEHSGQVATLIRDIGAEQGAADASDGPWICRLSDDFLARLVNLPHAGVGAVGAVWAESEWQDKVKQRPTTDESHKAAFIESLVTYLERLRELAIVAQAQAGHLFLYLSL
jgi:hypothetical protein